MYPSAKWEDLEKEFSCGRATLAHKACSLGIQRSNTSAAMYSESEDNILRAYHKTHTTKEISSLFLPHRTPSSIQTRMDRLGLDHRKRIHWDKETIVLFQSLYSVYPPAQVAEMMGTTYDAVINAARKFNVKSPFNRKYTEEELTFIRESYTTMNDAEISKIIGRPVGSVKEIRRLHGWRRPIVDNTSYNSLYQYLRKSNVCWKKNSKQQCNGLCVVTHMPSEAIHHLYGMNMIVDELIQQEGIDISTFDIDRISQSERKQLFQKFKLLQSKYPLGVCLTESIHLEFHDTYGYGNNTPQQFLNFIQCSYPKALDNILPFIGQ